MDLIITIFKQCGGMSWRQRQDFHVRIGIFYVLKRDQRIVACCRILLGHFLPGNWAFVWNIGWLFRNCPNVFHGFPEACSADELPIIVVVGVVHLLSPLSLEIWPVLLMDCPLLRLA